ncbi:MAG: hypothetical protein R2715_12165 [Ilumatobacteraceae bacterium]
MNEDGTSTMLDVTVPDVTAPDVTVDVTPYGRPASEALARAVAAAKGDDALAPVTVIVSSNFAGLAARRLLGSRDLGGGVANVQFVTPFRLAQLLAGGRGADAKPLTNPVLGAAVRLALADDPGPYAEVAEHQATIAAVSELYAELSSAEPGGPVDPPAGVGPRGGAGGPVRPGRR